MKWDEQQARFGEALLDPRKKVPDFVAKTGGRPSGRRFNVYRNNVMVSLTEALLDAYPVVTQLVGDEFATAMARVYAGENLPRSPVLLDYGADYAAFIERFEPAQSLPFLADVARLERAWLTAYHCADHVPLAIEALSSFDEQELGDLRFSFCPGVALVQSDHPVVSIWTAHQGEGAETALAAISQQGETALVNRPDNHVLVREISPAIHAFFLSLHQGQTLAMSLDKGGTFARFDPSQAIQQLFATGIVFEVKK